MLTKKRLILALKFAVSGLLIWFLFANVDLSAAKDRLLDVSPGMLAVAALVLVIQVIPATLRWLAVLDAIEAPLTFLKAVQIFWIGVFFNQTLPSSVGGDAVRMYVARRDGLSLRGAVNGVMLERVATVVALVLLVVMVQPFFLARVADEASRWFLPALALLAAVLAGGLALLMCLDRLPEALHRWRLVRGLIYLADDTRKVFLAPLPMGRAVGWGVVGHANVSMAVYALALGLGMEVTALDCIALVPPVILVTTLPVSIAGWGVREGAMVAAFGFIGATPESALVLSVLFGLVALVSSLPGGVIWMLMGVGRKEVEMRLATEQAAKDRPNAGG